MASLKITIKKDNTARLELRDKGGVVGWEDLTLDRNLDKLCINALDNLTAKNRIDRLSLKTLVISGKTSLGAVSGMIIKTIKQGLEG